MYTLAIKTYNCLLRLASLRNRKAKKLVQGRRQTLAKVREVRKPGERWVWLHAASLGEFEQGRPLLEMIRRNHPDLRIALSFYSPSGYEVRKDWPGADLTVYLPADTPAEMRRYIDTLAPCAAIIVKYEFWRNMLRILKEKQIPTFLISGIFRGSQLFFKPWAGWWRTPLKCFTHMYVQDEGSRRLLEGVGITNVTVAGDTRFDRVTDICNAAHAIPSLDDLTRGGTRLTLVFGSSWPADEAIYFPWLVAQEGNVKAIIAPHEFDALRLEKMRKGLSPLRTLLLSEAEAKPGAASQADVLIIDCFGLLSSAYRYGKIAYVGGGFGAGIHNINEAAVYSMPVIFGPRHGKFLEARELLACGGAREVRDQNSFREAVNPLLDPTERRKAGQAAGAYIRSKIGATPRIYAVLKEILTSPVCPKKK